MKDHVFFWPMAAQTAASQPAPGREQAAGSAGVDAAPPVPAPETALVLRAGQHEAAVAPGLATALTGTQVEGVQWLYGAFHGAHLPGCHGGILSHGEGCGATLQVIALLHTLIASKQARSVLLILRSTGVVEQWRSDVEKFTKPPDRPAAQPPLPLLVISDVTNSVHAARVLDRLRGSEPLVVAMTYQQALRFVPDFAWRGGRVDLTVADQAYAM